MIAQSFLNSAGQATPIGIWLLCAVIVLAALAVIMRNVLGAMADGKKLWGRNPPIDEDLRTYSATVAKLQQDLAKLPDEKKFSELVNRLGTFATVTQMAALQETFHRENTNVDVYSHTQVHRIDSELQAIKFHAAERGERLAAVEANIETLTRTVEAIDTKLDRQGERIADKVQGLLERWRREQ